jgi:sortase (surface protein transpeptidase)
MSRAAWLVGLAGLLLLVGAPVVWQLTATPPAAGDLDAVLAEEPSPDPAPTRSPAPATAPSDTATFTTTTPRGAVSRPPAPEQLTIPVLGVEAPIVPVALEDDGSMEIPEDVAEVGWFSPGVRPGADAGSAVLAGHVDARTQGPGALFHLERLQPGDEVRVAGGSATEVRYEVVARQRYGKAELPIPELFRRDGPHRLVLITCGGAFDPATRSYEENVVVVATPVDAAA